MLNSKIYSAIALISGVYSLGLFDFWNPASAQSQQCQQEIVLQSVEVLDGQGIGEGKLEMEIQVESGNSSQEVRAWKVPVGQSERLQAILGPFLIERGSSVQQRLTTTIVEREVGSDFAVGSDDRGSVETVLTLQCGTPQEIVQDAIVRGKNDAEVRVTYDIQDTSSHAVVIDSTNIPGATDYTINASGSIEQVEGTLAGHQVTIQNNDRVSGNSARGRVSTGADGFRVRGEIPEINLDNPDAATVYVDGQEYTP